jgi:hypothetical protein
VQFLIELLHTDWTTTSVWTTSFTVSGPTSNKDYYSEQVKLEDHSKTTWYFRLSNVRWW